MHSLSLVAVSEGYSLAVAHELLTVVTSRVAEYGFESTGSIVVVQGSSCFVASNTTVQKNQFFGAQLSL